MISDDMIHGAWAGGRVRPRTKRRPRSFPAVSERPQVSVATHCKPQRRALRLSPLLDWSGWDTPIMPRTVAEAVFEEATVWLGKTLPPRWVDDLCARAHTVYQRNEQFRRRIQAGGNKGRDWLWAFMRQAGRDAAPLQPRAVLPVARFLLRRRRVAAVNLIEGQCNPVRHGIDRGRGANVAVPLPAKRLSGLPAHVYSTTIRNTPTHARIAKPSAMTTSPPRRIRCVTTAS